MASRIRAHLGCHERQPELRGSCVSDGMAYWISAWVREGDEGKFFWPLGRGVPDSEIPF